MTDPYPKPRRLEPSPWWPKDWHDGYHYDSLEVWRDGRKLPRKAIGYAYQYASRRRSAIEALLEACPPPARVLDLAAATGNFSASLAGLGYDVTWNDMRADMIDYVRTKMPDDVNIEYIPQNIFDLGDTHIGSYDAVIALEVIEHVAHPDEFVAKLSTLLRPGGKLVLTTPNGGYMLNTLPRFSDHPDPSVFESRQFGPNSEDHIFLLYEDEMRRFADADGLDVDRVELITNPLTAGHIKLGYVLTALPESAVSAIERMTRKLPRRLRQLLSTHLVTVLSKPEADAA